MPDTPSSLAYYSDTQNAQRYHAQTGFDPARKQEMLQVTLSLLMGLAPASTSLLEIGCGSDLFTRMLAATEHFGSIYATDGAEAMLEIARPRFASALADRRIDQERGRVKLEAGKPSSADMEAFIQSDRQKQAAQGNHCESAADYLGYLEAAGFTSVDCLWRSYWLAVFMAQKPG